MLEKLKENKKTIIIVSIAIILVIGIGIFLGIKNSNKNNNVTSVAIEKKIENIAEEQNLQISDIANTKGGDISFNIVDSENKDIKEFTKNIYEYVSETNAKKISFKVFSSEKAKNEFKVFYTNGIINDVEIDILNKRAKIGTFESVPDIKKANTLNKYNKGTIEDINGNVIISMDMELNDNPADIVAQAKAFVVLFRDTNADADIDSVELHLNSNGKDKLYNFNNLYENILENIEIINY